MKYTAVAAACRSGRIFILRRYIRSANGTPLPFAGGQTTFGMPHSTPSLLQMEGIEKSFPGVKALNGVSLDLLDGEVLGIVGENGAGKSTLIKVLAGAHLQDAGTITIDGEPVSLHSPVDAQQAGVAVIYQEFNLIPSLTARENIYLGHENSRAGFFSARKERAGARELLARLDCSVNPDTSCQALRVAEQQLVEIAKALSLGARIIVMDEPSAALTTREVEQLFSVIRNLKADGIGIIYISHRLEEIFEIADRVLVLRDGNHIATEPIGSLNRDRLIELMVGRTLDQEFPKETHVLERERLVVSGLSWSNAVDDVSFTVRAGEVLGLTGLVGAGRTELARLLFGADPADRGSISLDGNRLTINSPLDAIRAGICLLTEDRKEQGLVLKLSVRENFGLPNLANWSRWGLVNRRSETNSLFTYVAQLSIKISDPEQLAQNLSGGNQQKVLLARWLESNSEVIIFDEPTRGIDVAAKYEIYLLINRLAAAGKSIVMISSELPEVLGMSDRILVMCQGRISGEIDNVASADQEDILTLATRFTRTAA